MLCCSRAAWSYRVGVTGRSSPAVRRVGGAAAAELMRGKGTMELVCLRAVAAALSGTCRVAVEAWGELVKTTGGCLLVTLGRSTPLLPIVSSPSTAMMVVVVVREVPTQSCMPSHVSSINPSCSCCCSPWLPLSFRCTLGLETENFFPYSAFSGLRASKGMRV